MYKTYISSLLVVLMAGAQVMQTKADSGSVGMETGTMASVSGDEAQTVAVAGGGSDLRAVTPENLMKNGIEYFKAGDYDQARVNFEAVLALEPYNKKAMNYLKKVSSKVYAYESRKMEAVRDGAFAGVKKAWNPNFEEALVTVSEKIEKGPKPVPEGVIKMTAHLQSIKIPSLDFRDANIKDVVLFLTETCRRIDSTGKGINVILLGLQASDSMEAAEDNNITISIRNMNLYNALQVITEMASMKFVVEPNMVLIMPVNYVRSVEVKTATFSVVPEVGEELSSMPGSGDSGDSMDNLFGGGDTGSISTDSGPVDVSGYFDMVDWSKGSKAIYYPNFRKLIIQNTEENIQKMRDILRDLEDEAIARRSSQVEIEAKFVEFSEGSMEELGFNWTVNGSGDIGGFKLDPDYTTYSPAYGHLEAATLTSIQATTGNVITQDLDLEQQMAEGWLTYNRPVMGYRVVDEGQSLFGGITRNAQNAFADVGSGILASMGGYPASMVFTDGTIDFQINAMEQNGTADILSAPRITTQSGYEAVIRVTEIHRYPQDWDVETGQRTAPVVKPQDWEDFDLGVVLRVTPEVDAESNTIKLELNPEIRQFKGFDGYHVADNAYDAGTSNTERIRGDGTELYAEMPYFETRSVQTRITVADGSTVMMGGLVDEITETYRDQIPILGDIPYIGRLFRTEGSRSSKKNLVIFVKATQVDEKGMTRLDREMAARAGGN